jgi:coupling of ubiquitin conjugation to ER degradation protein 1
MANSEQVNLPSLLVILVLTGLVVRYFFFSSGTGAAAGSASQLRNNGGRTGRRAADAVSVMAAREAAVVRLQQLFPQVDRRTLLWDLQRTGGNIQRTAERVATRRLETVSLPLVVFVGLGGGKC